MHFSACPSSLAWEAFGEKNGAASYAEMRMRIARYRHHGRPSAPQEPGGDYQIGCIILQDPFFFPQDDWIPSPEDFHPNIVQGKSYDLRSGTGQRLWVAVQDRLQRARSRTTTLSDTERPAYGDPVLVKQRLGQGAFRVLVTDTYERRCAVTREKALPALEAAHIRPIHAGGGHRVENGLLLRSDLHRLFDAGYVTIGPDYQLRVSRRLKDDFDNGEHYYQMRGSTIWLPQDKNDQPQRELLEWHADTVFRR